MLQPQSLFACMTLAASLLVLNAGARGQGPTPKPRPVANGHGDKKLPAAKLTQPAPSANPEARAQDKHALNAFACDLYARMREKEGNLFFAPQSIATALAMTHAGARGETARQIATVLHLPDRPELVYSTFLELQRQLNPASGSKGYELLSANGLWAPKDYPFLPDYLRVVRELYGATVQEADFDGDAAGAAKAVNAWVEEQTRQKIRNFFPEGGLSDAAPPIWVNAVYFKSSWANPFRVEKTKPGPFFIQPNEPKTVPFMQKIGNYRWADAGKCEILELPYVGHELRMIVLLPKKKSSLAETEKELTSANLAAWLGKLKQEQVEVILPRFQFADEVELSAVLKGLGIMLAFGPKADFSAVHGGKGSFQLSQVLHKAVLEVNEEGTEAAAATAVKVPRSVSIAEPPRQFKADHPFCFLIQDTRSGCILFVGRLQKP